MSTNSPTSRPGILSLLWAIRDSRSTKGAQRHLLNALALRCSEKKNYSCWPSYDQLSKDTQLDEVTLKRAAAKLESAEVIKRVTRPNRANIWFLNVAAILSQAAATRTAEKAIADNDDFKSPFGDPVLPAEDAETGGDENTGWNVGGVL